MRLVVLAAMVVLASGLAVAQDRLILLDGQVVTGRILSTTPRDVTILSDNETMRVPRLAIETIERGTAAHQPSSDQRVARATTALRPGDGRTPAFAQPEFPEATPQILGWVSLCIRNLGSETPEVRQGARAALRFVGPAARPALEAAAANGDEWTVDGAERLLEWLDRIEAQMARRRGKASTPVVEVPAADPETSEAID